MAVASMIYLASLITKHVLPLQEVGATITKILNLRVSFSKFVSKLKVRLNFHIPTEMKE